MVAKRSLVVIACWCAAALGTAAVAQERRADAAAQAANESVQAVEQRLQRISSEISGATRELGATKQRIAELEQDRQRQAREIEKLREELARCREQRTKQEEQLREARQKISASENQVRERDQQLAAERQATEQQSRVFEQHVQALSRGLSEVRDAHLREANQLEERLTRGHENLGRLLATFASQDAEPPTRRSKCTPSRRAVVQSPAADAPATPEKKIND